MLSKKQNSKASIILAIFAHPDDESCGPGGTIAKFAQHSEVQIICVTNGEAGGNNKKLAEIRAQELKNSAKILGVRKVHFLDYKDGTLSNNLYHEIAKDLEQKIEEIKPQTVITFEPLGVSGHIDHIAVALVATYVVRKHKFINKIMYYCSDYREVEDMGSYFIFNPQGFRKNQVDEIIDITDVWDKKVKAMNCHKSQIKDIKMILNKLEKLPKEEYFLTSIRR